MKNLISNTAFGKIVESKLTLGEIDFKEYFILRCNFDKFLKQPLELWMFVPCDEDGNILSEKYSAKEDTENKSFTKLSNEYKQAKDNVLFEGFESERKNTVINDDIQILFYKSKFVEVVEIFDGQMPDSKGKISIIEDLVKYNLQLTPTAQKQIGI